MRILTALFIAATLPACASQTTQSAFKMTCEPTNVRASDLEKFGLQPAPGKIMVVRVLRTTCPSCRSDLDRIGDLYQNGTWNKDKVQLVVIGYKKPGFETRATFDAFVRERFSALGIPLESAQIIWLNKSYDSLLRHKNANGHPLFAEWKSVPYAMIFAKDGRLVFRGQFARSPQLQEAQYAAVTDLQEETCIR